MKIIIFDLMTRHLNGWRPNWAAFVFWLKDRKRLADKEIETRRKETERKAHNDKVLRMYGLLRKKDDFWR
jgi:hypothetical protein